MDIMVVFQTMLKLFLLLILGFVLFKCHIFDEYTNKKISALIVNVASPMLIISSIAGVEGSNKSIVFLMIGAGILMYIGFIILLRSYVYAYSLLLTIFRSHSGTGDSGRGTIAAGVADNEFLPP